MKMPGTDARAQNEGAVKKKVKALLDKHDWFWWMPPANGFGKSGIADFNAVKSGMFLAVETKSGKNKPTPQQIGFLNSIRSASHFAFVVSEANLDALGVFLLALDDATQATTQGQEVPPETGAAMLNSLRALTALLPETM